MKSNVIAGSIGLIAGIVLTLLLSPHLPKSPENAKFKITAPDGKASFEFEAAGGQVDYVAILKELFDDDIMGPGALEWLKTSHAVYPLQDVALVRAVGSQLCEPIPEEGPLEDRLEAARACAEVEVASGLRQLASGHKPPFHYVGTQSRLGVPGEVKHRPRPGHANVCKEKGLLGKNLEVADPASGRSVQVLATGYYPCTGMSLYPDIQLAEQDARKIFGRPLSEYEEVVVVPLE